MIIGNREEFGFEITKISDENHISELKLYIKGNNVCAWKRYGDGRYKSVRWNLDDLVMYLDSTLQMMNNDTPFPFDVEGECAAEIDNNSRDYDVDDEEQMDAYYDRLNDWSYEHSWHHASGGAVLADVFFRKVTNGFEISWWNEQTDSIIFKHTYGFVIVPDVIYCDVVNSLVDEYNNMWK